MNELVEKLLSPVSPDHPCGPDLSYDPRYEELETILKGKPEVDIGTVQKPPEPPDWVQLTEKSAEFLRHTKHVRAAVILSCSLLQTGGFAGFRDGVQLIRGLLERYWPILYPLLDAEDHFSSISDEPQPILEGDAGLEVLPTVAFGHIIAFWHGAIATVAIDQGQFASD